MSRARVQHRWSNIGGAFGVLVFLLAVLFFDRPVAPEPPATVQAAAPWQCPEVLERVVERHRAQVNAGRIPDASTALLQKYHRVLCDTIFMRDQIVAGAEYQRIPEYVEQHEKLQDIQLTLGYWEADERQPSYSPTATGMWFTFLVMAQSMEPVAFHWVKCELESPGDGDQCWLSQTRLGEITVFAELYGPFSSLRVDTPIYTFTRTCDGLRPESAEQLWNCPIDMVQYHPDGYGDACSQMFSTWTRTGILTYFRPDDGPFCPEYDLLPPVQIEPEWPDHEKSPAPTPMPDGWYHL